MYLKKTLNLEKTIVRYVLGRSKRLETNTVPFILATFGAAIPLSYTFFQFVEWMQTFQTCVKSPHFLKSPQFFNGPY